MTNLKTQFQIGHSGQTLCVFFFFFFFLILELAQKTSCLLALWSLNRHPSLCLWLNEVLPLSTPSPCQGWQYWVASINPRGTHNGMSFPFNITNLAAYNSSVTILDTPLWLTFTRPHWYLLGSYFLYNWLILGENVFYL